MERFKIKYICTTFLICCLTIQQYQAQVGIGTSKPEGALDLETSSYGLVYPRIALTATNTRLPVANPVGGNLVAGTVVYNTSLTTNGSNDLYPGLYAWDGSSWKPQFIMEEYKKYSQTGGCQRTTIRESYGDPRPDHADNVAGLTNQTFTPKYSGIYKIDVKTNFGAGEMINFTGSYDKISLATSEGAFFFQITGAGVNIVPTIGSYDYKEGWMYTHSYSSHNRVETPTIQNNNVGHYVSVTHYKYLLSGSTYTFNLSNCINTGHAYFLNNGDSGEGRGHIGHDIPCTVEFTFIGD
jgi:hypothetical protein